MAIGTSNLNNFSDFSIYINELKTIVIDNKNKLLVDEIASIEEIIHPSFFKIAIVGEFSRGKSTLINKLLGTEILSVGVLPTTALITLISYGRDKKIVWVNEKGDRQVLDFTPDSWKKIVVTIDGPNPDGHIEIEWPDSWLMRNNVQLIDTPGFEKLSPEKDMQVKKTIARCDAAFVLVDALTPMSIIERKLVEEHILSKQVPRVAIIITKLDLVDEIEREDVILHVKSKTKGWFGDLPIVITEACMLKRSNIIDSVGIEGIKQLVGNWVDNDKSYDLKKAQLKNLIGKLCESLKSELIEFQKIMELSDDEKKIEFKKLEREISHKSLTWDMVKVDGKKREKQCFDITGEAIFKKKITAVQRLNTAIDSRNNIEQLEKWLKDDLPFVLRRYINTDVIPEAVDVIQNKYNIDTVAINEMLDREFGMSVAADSVIDSLDLTDSINVRPAHTGETIKTDKYMESGKSMLTGSLAAGSTTLKKLPKKFPAKLKAIKQNLKSIGPQIALQIVVDQGANYIQKQIDLTLQKKILKDQMDMIVEDAFCQTHDLLKDNIREFYGSLTEELTSSKDTWIENHKKELSIRGEESKKKIQHYVNLISDVENIRKKVLSL